MAEEMKQHIVRERDAAMECFHFVTTLIRKGGITTEEESLKVLSFVNIDADEARKLFTAVGDATIGENMRQNLIEIRNKIKQKHDFLSMLITTDIVTKDEYLTALDLLHFKLETEEACTLFSFVEDAKSKGVLSSEFFFDLLQVAEKWWLEQLSRAAATDESEAKPMKYIALISHDKMKQKMMEFVQKHLVFFKTAQIVTTSSTGTLLENELGLKVEIKVNSGPLGGDQELGAMVARGDIYCSFFFVDPLSSHSHSVDIDAYIRICNVYDSLIATNLSSAESAIRSLASEEFRKKIYDEAGQSFLKEKYLKNRSREVMGGEQELDVEI